MGKTGMNPTLSLTEVCGVLQIPAKHAVDMIATGTFPVDPFWHRNRNSRFATATVLKVAGLDELPDPIPEPPSAPTAQQHYAKKNCNYWLYRMYDEDGELLYVGQSKDAISRWKQHARDKDWISEVSIFTREPRFDQEDLDLAEKAAILNEEPRYNVVHNQRRIA
ncbi:GIY-YIG nuclease family protein [Corynebacterium coyleae]|uniref:GIY-YIG nuclease family protein n=1 Tax=Corynebacterium coyleae TaxID=53374 RepID=UPI00254D74A7|nr:GIY-YIG nuclease family protein [Corynebacterium coyleae]MDK8242565.1 GIY-YIG nuclease family protein [Corynebacterium coyleae]